MVVRELQGWIDTQSLENLRNNISSALSIHFKMTYKRLWVKGLAQTANSVNWVEVGPEPATSWFLDHSTLTTKPSLPSTGDRPITSPVP